MRVFLHAFLITQPGIDDVILTIFSVILKISWYSLSIFLRATE